MLKSSSNSKSETALTEIEEHIANLSHRNARTRLNAARALEDLSCNNTINNDEIRRAKGIAQLVHLLKQDDSTEIKISVAVTLYNLTCNNPINQDAVRKAGGIAALVMLLNNKDAEMRLEVAGALGHLAHGNTANQEAIRANGGIHSLVALLSDINTEVKHWAAVALLKLSRNNLINQAAMIDCGALPLLRALSSTDESAHKALEACQATLDKRRNEQKELRKVQPTPKSIKYSDHTEIMEHIANLTHRSTKKRRDAVGVLLSLSNNETNQDAIRGAKGIAPLIALLGDDLTEIKKTATITLYNLTCNNPMNQDVIRKSKGIAPLVMLLKDSDPDVRLEAAGALGNLAHDNTTNQDVIREAGGIDLLVALLSNINTEVRHWAVIALLELSRDNLINQAEMINCGALPLIGALASTDENASKLLNIYQATLKKQENEQIKLSKKPLLLSVVETTDHTEIKDHIINLSHRNIPIRRNATRALLEILCENPTSQDTIRETKGIMPLIALLNDSDTEVRQHAAGALMSLARNNKNNQDKIQKMQGIIPLIKLLNDPDTGVKQKAAGALSVLACSNETNQDAIREAQGIMSLITLLYDPDDAVVRQTGRTLSDLARCNETNQNAIRKAQGIIPLIALLKLNDRDTGVRQNAAGALWNLASGNETNQDAIREAQGILPLLALLNDPNDTIVKRAAGALSELACSNETNQNAILEAQGIIPLITLLNNPDAVTRGFATRVLLDLASNQPLNQDTMIDYGILPLLHDLAITDENARNLLEILEPTPVISQELTTFSEEDIRILQSLVVTKKKTDALHIERQTILSHANQRDYYNALQSHLSALKAASSVVHSKYVDVSQSGSAKAIDWMCAAISHAFPRASMATSALNAGFSFIDKREREKFLEKVGVLLGTGIYEDGFLGEQLARLLVRANYHARRSLSAPKADHDVQTLINAIVKAKLPIVQDEHTLQRLFLAVWGNGYYCIAPLPTLSQSVSYSAKELSKKSIFSITSKAKKGEEPYQQDFSFSTPITDFII